MFDPYNVISCVTVVTVCFIYLYICIVILKVILNRLILQAEEIIAEGQAGIKSEGTQQIRVRLFKDNDIVS